MFECRILFAVEVLPTAPGDPLLPEDLSVPFDPTEVLVTETLAEKLNLGTGKALLALVKRIDRNRHESAELDLRVIGVVPESNFAKDALFATPDLLAAVEDYRDGLLGPLSSADLLLGRADARRYFANARVYAAGLDRVATLARTMRDDGIEVRTLAEAIDSVRAVDGVLSFVFYVIALVAGIGCTLALGGTLWVNVDRKHRELALLGLIGFGNRALILVPAIQSLAVSGVGLLLAGLAYQVGATTFNQVLGTHLSGRGYACRMEVDEALAAVAATLVIALLAGAAAGIRASRIDPAQSLREGH